MIDLFLVGRKYS